MRILLILILAGLSAWLQYDRSATKEKLQLALDKIAETQASLDQSKRQTETAMGQLAQLTPEHQNLIAKLTQQQSVTAGKQAEVNQKEAELAQKQTEVERLSKKTWLQDQIESRGDPLAPHSAPPANGNVRRTPPTYNYNPNYPYKNP